MIRYPITEVDLLDKITAVKATWLSRARKRTDTFRKAGAYAEPPAHFWGEIKDVYRELQHHKCAYCERKMGGSSRGRIDFDVEHFRPKSDVEEWPTHNMASLKGISYTFSTGKALPEGYFLLAYNPLNYLAACKICNSSLKATYFPIAGTRMDGIDNPRTSAAELPFLIYPIGDIDDDPETLIRFEGPIPVPVSPSDSSHQYRRAQVTIALLELDVREELLRERSDLIAKIFVALESTMSADPVLKEIALRSVAATLRPGNPHHNCASSYCNLYRTDPATARRIADGAITYIDSLK